MKIIIHIQPEELLVLMRDKDRVSIEHKTAWLNDLITPQDRQAYERNCTQDGAEIFGSALRGSMPATEPSPEDWHNQLQQ